MCADLDNTKVILIATGNGIYKKGKMTFAVKFLSLALYKSSKEESLWGELYSKISKRRDDISYMNICDIHNCSAQYQ